MIYIFFLLPFLFASFLDFENKQILFKKVIIYYLILFSILITGFRYYTGGDWHGYLKYYNIVDWEDNKYPIGFKVLNIFSKRIFNSYYPVQIFANTFLLFSVISFYKKYSETPIVALCIFMITHFDGLLMSQVRQAIAVGIIIMGFKYVFEGKFLHYLFFVLCACLFHSASFICLGLYLFIIPFPKILRIFFSLSSILILFFPTIPLNILALFAQFVPGTAGDLARKYFGSRMVRSAVFGSGSYFYARWFLSFLVVLFYNPKNRKDYVIINAFIAGMFMKSISANITLFGRIGTFFDFLVVLGFTYFLKLPRKLKLSTEVYSIVFVLFLTFMAIPYFRTIYGTKINVITGRTNIYRYVPYYNILLHPQNAYRKDWNE